MLSIAIPHEWVFFGARAALLTFGLLVFGVALRRWRSTTVAQADRLAANLEAAHDELRALTGISIGLTAQVAALQEQIAARAELAVAARTPAASGYDVGMRLARSGASPEEISATSGVTRQEALLLARLHGPENRVLRTGT